MSFIVLGEDGWAGDLATAKGWDDVIQFVTQYSPTGPLADFCYTGTTVNMKGVISDIAKLLPEIKDKDVRNTLDGLKTSLAKCKEIAIVTQ